MFEQTWILAAIPIVVIILFLLLKKNIVSYDNRYRDEQSAQKRQHRSRILMLISRTLIFTLLIVALATPLLQTDVFTDSDPKIIVLTDESSSMNIFEQTQLVEQLREQAQVREYSIASGNTSVLADPILSRIEAGGHVVLLSDGQITSGASLSSVASYAASIQATLNAVQLPIANHDAGVSIISEELVVQNSQTTLTIELHTTDGQPRDVIVSVDDEVIDTRTTSESYTLEHSFSAGTHTISAEIQQADAIAQNNEYVATITATPRPSVLLVGNSDNGLEELLSQLYDVQTTRTLPQDIDAYATIILNNVARSAIRTNEQALQQHLTAGGGMLVVGGENSYEFGSYENTLLEAILPVRVGTGANQLSSGSIAIAIDLSGSTLGGVQFVRGETVQATQQTLNIQKALAVDLVEKLNANNRVGALGFTYPQPRSEDCSGACVLGQIRPLGEHREELAQNIARVDLTGGTAIWVGMQGAMQMLERSSGSQNIVLISDGVSGAQDKDQALNIARTFRARGGKVYPVHVGNTDQGFAFMQQLAVAGGGLAFTADQDNRLAVLFGEPENVDEQDAYSVIPIDEYHFITRDIESTATLFGYNQVIPKDGAHQLLASNSGQPVLTIWNYGVGRVASLTAFSGETLGSLLQLPNSKYLSRTVNWAIGPLERVQNNLLYAQDARVGEEISIYATGSRPDISGVTFSRIDNNQYEAIISPQEQGVYTVGSTTYAVNRPQEFDKTGLSQELIQAVELTGGRMYESTDVQGIIEHAQSLSEIKEVQQEPIRWPFILAALIIYFLEVLIRRISALKKRS
jgi:uncharacterized membrane protein